MFLIGVAELRRRFGAPIYGVLVLCVAWSLMLAFVHNIGYDGITAGDGVGRTLTVTRQTHNQLEHKLKLRATDRWNYLWALLHGEDPQHVNGP